MGWLTVRKALYCILRPALWRALALRTAPSIEHGPALRGRHFRTVVDVGANRGQFTLFARHAFPSAHVVSFEPLDGPARSFARLFDGDCNVELHRVAIGRASESATIHVMSSDDSSSLLQPERLQSELFHTAPTATQTVDVRRLAEVLEPSAIVRPALMKIDVQGFELEVLEGSRELLDAFDALLIECSYLALYKDQPLAADIISWLSASGFGLAGVFNQHVDARLGPVQADFLFRNRKSSELP